jgi:hypothetical protein
MPAELTNPISIHTGAPSVTSEISIKEIVIRPPGVEPGGINLVIAQGDGESSYRIPGSFLIADNDDPTRKEQIAGKQFDIPVGNFFTDAAGAAPSGATMFDAVKDGCYAALMARYPDLAGNVT